MDDLSPPAAKSVSASLRPIPFGMRTLDAGLGGLPSGTAALLSGAADAGADAFVATHAAQVMLASHDPALFSGDLRRFTDALPEQVVYLTFSKDSEHVLHAMDAVLDQYQFDALTANLKLLDYSMPFLNLIDTPAAFDRDPQTEGPLAEVEDRSSDVASFEALIEDAATDLDEWGEGAIVIVDSLNDLYRAQRFGLTEQAILSFLIGLREATVDWKGLTHVLYNKPAEQVRDDSLLNSLLHGNIFFYSNDQGFETYRTMRVGSFGGAMDREQQVVYATQVGSAGFRVKATKKISPGNW